MSAATDERTEGISGEAEATPGNSRAGVIRPAGGPTPPIYRFARGCWRALGSSYLRVSATGVENVPKDGPCIILSNHASHLDGGLIGGWLGRELQFIGRASLFDVPVLRSILARMNTHMIKRGAVDREAVRKCVAILEAGWPLVFFPEGTRTPDGRVGKPLGGIGLILDRAPETPLVPTLIRGTYQAMGKGKVAPRPARVTISFGEPYRMEPRPSSERRRDFYQRCADRIEAEWRKMGAYDA